MHVQLALEGPHTVFTNLDVVAGKVVLRLSTTTPITSIVVKLEGESHTRLLTPRGRTHENPNDRPRPVEEIHKILYKLATVFPDPSFANIKSGKGHLTLAPGHYEFPFSFKIPFNNACHESTTASNIQIGALRLEPARPQLRHTRTTLPPTLTTFPGEAEIHYFLKVTVNRKEFYKENPRVLRDFNFLPIEPPRPKTARSETYARRRHHFAPITPAGPSKQKMKRAFTNLSKTATASSSPSSDDLPDISLEARLPDPSIITCNERVPLKLFVKRMNNYTHPVYLQSIQVELIGHTHIRASPVQRDETSSWVLVSQSNVTDLLKFTSPSATSKSDSKSSKENGIDSATQEVPIANIDMKAWSCVLPPSVCPSFETCNVSRRYDLEVRIGIGYGSNSQRNQIILPLRLPVSVYSGVHPPEELLNAMSARQQLQQAASSAAEEKGKNSVTKKPLTPEAESNVAAAQAQAENAGPGPSSSAPISAAGPALAPPVAIPPQGHTFAPLPAGEEEPPPSYEDVVAVDMGPVDGPRNYQPPPNASAMGSGDKSDDEYAPIEWDEPF